MMEQPWRRRLVELYGVLAVVFLGSLPFERHRASWHASSGEWSAWHSLAVEGYLIPVALALVTVLACVWARRRAPRGALAAAAGLATALATLLTHLLSHVLQDVEGNAAAAITTLGALILMLGALVLFVADPIAAYRARAGRGTALRDVALTGRRRIIRDVILALVIAVALPLALLLVLERHIVTPVDDYDAAPFEEWFVRDTYGAVLLAPMLVVLSALWARRGFPRGVVAGLVTFVAAVASLTAWIVLHTLAHASSATNWALLSLTALAFLGPALAIVDAVVHTRERRRTERRGPELPPARIA
jgi:hypothetical protein